MPMIYKENIAQEIAQALLQVKAIKLNPQEPFQWASGILSPIYCDNRVTLSYPEIRAKIADAFKELIQDKFSKVSCIAGVATGGIAHGALLAERLNLPFIYVRSQSKGHGLQNQIEGRLNKEDRVVLVEDLVSSGMSSLRALKAVEQKCTVLGMVSIFNYGFQKAIDAFKEHDCLLYNLSDYLHLIDRAVLGGYVTQDQIEMLKSWRQNPKKWKT